MGCEGHSKVNRVHYLKKLRKDFNPFSATRHDKRLQKVKVKGLGRKSSYLAGFFLFFFLFMVL